jgi:uncharacterized membrane protein
MAMAMAMQRHQVDGADRQQGTIDTVIDLFGGFSPLATDQFATVAGAMDATTMQLALAWLLQRSRRSCAFRAPPASRTYGRTWRPAPSN